MTRPYVSFMEAESDVHLQKARALGFDKLMYGVDVLDGEIDPPLEIVAAGLSPEYMDTYLGRMREDPIRRMAARGEFPVTNAPLNYENTGSGISIARRRAMSARDTAMLRWFLSQGVRTSVAFRIRMSQGRYASINFYSDRAHAEFDMETTMASLFMLGHQLHARLEPKLSKWRGDLLSSREAECLQWIAAGKSNREIADLLCISVDTAKEHIQSLFHKLRVHGRAQAVSRGHLLAYLG